MKAYKKKESPEYMFLKIFFASIKKLKYSQICLNFECENQAAKLWVRCLNEQKHQKKKKTWAAIYQWNDRLYLNKNCHKLIIQPMTSIPSYSTYE